MRKEKCEVHDVNIIYGPCPECEEEIKNEEKIGGRDETDPTKILIREHLAEQLKVLDGLAEKCQREKDLLVAGYLIALGHLGADKVLISPDYTFLTLIKEEKKDDGKGKD